MLEISERGRSLGIILISAQQFASGVHPRVVGNIGTRVIGRTGGAEMEHAMYRSMDRDLRSAVTRLRKGELMIDHSVYRRPMKIRFPRPAYPD